jgi:hypothetical protein
LRVISIKKAVGALVFIAGIMGLYLVPLSFLGSDGKAREAAQWRWMMHDLDARPVHQ